MVRAGWLTPSAADAFSRLPCVATASTARSSGRRRRWSRYRRAVIPRVRTASGGQLPRPLGQVVEVAPELVEDEADPEQAPDLVHRKGTRKALPPHPIEGGLVGAEGLDHFVGQPWCAFSGQSLAEALEAPGTGPGRVRPGLRQLIAHRFVPGSARGPTQHDHVVTQPQESPEQGSRVSPMRKATPSLARCLSNEGLQLSQTLAGGYHKGPEIRRGMSGGLAQHFELLGQQPRDAGGGVQERAGGPSWHDQDGSQQPNSTAQPDLQNPVESEAERAQSSAGSAEQHDDGRDRGDAEASRGGRQDREGRHGHDERHRARQGAAMRDSEGDCAPVHRAAHRPGEAVERHLERAADIALDHDQGRDDGPEPLREAERRRKAERGEAGRRHAQCLHHLRPVPRQPAPYPHC